MIINDQATILITRKFDKELLDHFIESMNKIQESGASMVTLVINSPGGNLDVLQTMLDIMYDTPMTVRTVGTGLVASCGVMLLLAGDIRYAYASTQIMSHQYTWAAKGKHHELEAARKAQDLTHKFAVNHYKLHTGLKESIIQKELLPPEDVWLSAEEALAYNLIDEVISTGHKEVGHIARTKNKLGVKKYIEDEAVNMLNSLPESVRDKLLNKYIKADKDVKNKDNNKG